MNDLEAVLASVRSRIARHRGQSIGEQNTKNVLIGHDHLNWPHFRGE